MYFSNAFCVLLPDAKSVGVMGDHRTYEATVVLRAVTSEDYMTADWSKTTLETSGEDVKIHSKRVEKM